MDPENHVTWPTLMNEHTKMRRDEMIHEMDGRNILSRVVALPWSWMERKEKRSSDPAIRSVWERD